MGGFKVTSYSNKHFISFEENVVFFAKSKHCASERSEARLHRSHFVAEKLFHFPSEEIRRQKYFLTAKATINSSLKHC